MGELCEKYDWKRNVHEQWPGMKRKFPVTKCIFCSNMRWNWRLGYSSFEINSGTIGLQNTWNFWSSKKKRLKLDPCMARINLKSQLFMGILAELPFGLLYLKIQPHMGQADLLISFSVEIAKGIEDIKCWFGAGIKTSLLKFSWKIWLHSEKFKWFFLFSSLKKCQSCQFIAQFWTLQSI